MTAQRHAERINIRPGVSILSVLRHLNYRPWFAMAEFVDNALQSFLERRDELNRIEGADFRLRVAIEFDTTDTGRIIVRDNAAGIHQADYFRAFRPAEVPADRSGLSEFGMGMKSAACWFASNWVVRTTALGEPIERTVSFDIAHIVQDRIEELAIATRRVPEEAHYTEITLEGLHKPPQGRTVGKIKEHLASIYRVFLRDGVLELLFDKVPLQYQEPSILTAPHYKSPNEPPRVWRREINFDFGLGLRAFGFAALRETASVSGAGFALFRRNRLIQGSAEDGYRPEYIFGKSNSYRFQRLFGELHLEGFQVSHTKDGFQWDGNEETFLEFLKEHLDDADLPLLQQAEGHRVRAPRSTLQQAATVAVQRTAAVVQAAGAQALQVADSNTKVEPPALEPELRQARSLAREVVREVEWRGRKWQITIDLADDPAIGDWLTLSSDQDAANGRIGIRLAIAHPFMDRFVGAAEEALEPLLRVGIAIALSEVAARAAGVPKAGAIRRSINELLADPLAKP